MSNSFVNRTPLGSIQDDSDPLTSITGSCHLLDFNLNGSGNHRLVIDFGTIMGSKIPFSKNMEFPIDPMTGSELLPSSVDSVIATHIHEDHVGMLPRLVGKGYEGNIFMTDRSSSILDKKFYDSLYVMNNEYLKNNSICDKQRKRLGSKLNNALREPHLESNKKILEEYNINKNSDIKIALDTKIGTKIELLYTEDDILQTLSQIKSFSYYKGIKTQIFNVFPNTNIVKARLIDAGHVFGSAMVLIEVHNPKKNKVFNILWSGDLGRFGNRKYGNSPSIGNIKKKLDILFSESTYGGRNHSDINQEYAKIESSINQTFWNGGTVLSPEFTLERFQNKLLFFIESIESNNVGSLPKDTEIICDSPLARKYLIEMAKFENKYKPLLNHPNIIWSNSTEELLFQKKNKRIFLLSGGFINGGTIMKLVYFFDKRLLKSLDTKNGKKGDEESNVYDPADLKYISEKGIVIISGYVPPDSLGHQILSSGNYNSIQVNNSAHIDHQGIVDFITDVPNEDGDSNIKLRDSANILLGHGSLDSMYKIKHSLVESGINPGNIIIPSQNGKTFTFEM